MITDEELENELDDETREMEQELRENCKKAGLTDEFIDKMINNFRRSCFESYKNSMN